MSMLHQKSFPQKTELQKKGLMGVFEKRYALSSLGSSLWDTTVMVSSEDIDRLGLTKGTGIEVSSIEQARVLQEVTTKDSKIFRGLGGSSCNLVRTLASLGIEVSFSTIVGQDPTAQQVRDALDMSCLKTYIHHSQGSTGSVLVLVSEDGERTMLSSLGVGEELGKDHLCCGDILTSSIFHVCGYQWFHSAQRKAIIDAVAFVKASGGKVSFDLADPLVVKTFKKDFLKFIDADVDILFANHMEACELLGQEDAVENPKFQLKDDLVYVHKLGDKGAKIYEGGEERCYSKALAVKVVDTTGAGDNFAAGFLAGYILQKPHSLSAQIATILAGDVITRFGVQCSEQAIDTAKTLLHSSLQSSLS
ncbi:MAG: adenosine kinase [Proteobacteria bacterium]|nr:adenosine kinase [Pseudomonadota bacterium]